MLLNRYHLGYNRVHSSRLLNTVFTKYKKDVQDINNRIVLVVYTTQKKRILVKSTNNKREDQSKKISFF